MLVTLKRQQFKDNESDMTESRISKCQCIDIYDNEEGQSLDKYEDKGNRYIFLLPLSQKESNRLINLGEKINNLNHLICITKFS